MDFLLARLDQLEKDRKALMKENQELRNELADEKIKVRLLQAKNKVIYERNSEQYFNEKND